MTKILSTTESVCPECLARIPAVRVLEGEDVYLEKTCPRHGDFRTIIWRGKPAFTSWMRPKTPSFPKNPTTEVKDGCPFDCGLCGEHRQHTCSVLLEITQRCDLHCPVCFADAGRKPPPDMPISEIAAWYERLLGTGDSFNIQLSGGEPCLREDLPEIIRLGCSYGFSFFQVNTNGLRLARDASYLEELKKAGLSAVFLQFDGVQNATYQQLRGRDLLNDKIAVIEHCAELDIGVVLVPTLVPGINTQEIGEIIHLALAYMPAVRGVHFQPISYFGRYPENPSDKSRITIPEVIQVINEQTDGRINTASFCPPGCENAACSFHANFVLMPDGNLKALTYRNTNSSCCKPAVAAEGAARTREFVAENWSSPAPNLDLPTAGASSFDEMDVFLQRRRTHFFCISGMAFQDAWTLDLERLRDCCIHIAHPDGRLVPFCAYNLTSRQGQPLYRKPHETHPT